MVKQGKDFEVKVVKFLEQMGFHDIDGAREDFKIGNHKPDAIGVKEGINC